MCNLHVATDTLLSLASNPKQYDGKSIRWMNDLSTPRIRFFWETIIQHSPFPWSGKSILDIGTGTGWLISAAKALNTKLSIGIDPSRRNIAKANHMFPNNKYICTSIEQYSPSYSFDIVTMVMVIQHILDYEKMFEKISDLLTPGGCFFLIAPDLKYFISNRYNYIKNIRAISHDEYVVATTRPKFGTLVDIIRRTESYIQVAEQTGFVAIQSFPLIPDDKLRSKESKYKSFENTPLAHLLIGVK